MPRTPSLDALRIFVVAAQHLSFTEAAAELNPTESAVRHRIRGLEDEFDISLFNRPGRRLELTRHDGSPLKVTMLPSVASHTASASLKRDNRYGDNE